MSDYLPLFPLSLAVFPGETLKLHIFEPRYQQLISDCEEEGFMFGIPPVIEQEMMNVATIVELQRVDQRFPSGESNVTIIGKNKFRIERFFLVSPDKLYPGAMGLPMVEDDNFDQTRLADLQQEILDLMFQLHDALGIHKSTIDTPSDITAYKIAHDLGLTLRQEAELLGMSNEIGRLNYLFDHLQHILPVVRETERLKARAQLNGHYKNLVPPSF